MTAGLVRFPSGSLFRLPLSTPPARAKAVLRPVALMLAMLVLWPAPPAWAQVPPAAAPSAAAKLEEEISKVVAALPTMSPSEAVAKLSPLLAGDLSDVLPSAKMAGFGALAAAHERLAQDARLNTADPSSESKAQQEIDKAAAAYVAGAQVAAADGNTVIADQLFNRALAHRPEMQEAVLGLARLYATQNPLQSIEYYQQYLKKLTPAILRSQPELYMEMGRVYAGANLWHQALQAYRQAMTAGLDSHELNALLAGCYMSLSIGDKVRGPKYIEESLEYAQQAIAGKPDEPAYYRLLAELLLGLNDYPKAAERAVQGIQLARQRLARQPDDQTTLSILNDCYSVYLRILDTIVKGNPADLQSRLTLVQVMLDQAEVGRLLSVHRALGVLDRALEKDRTGAALLEQRLRLQRLIQHKDLRRTCERLLQADPDNRLARETLALLAAATQPAADSGSVK